MVPYLHGSLLEDALVGSTVGCVTTGTTPLRASLEATIAVTPLSAAEPPRNKAPVASPSPVTRSWAVKSYL